MTRQCDFCGSVIVDPKAQLALLSESAVQKLEANRVLRHLGGPSVRLQGQARYVACAQCMSRVQNTQGFTKAWLQ